MRSVVSKEEKVGLLLFDEPSASLDPTAEHGQRSKYFLDGSCTDVILQISLLACANCEATRLCSSPHIASATLPVMPISYCRFRVMFVQLFLF